VTGGVDTARNTPPPHTCYSAERDRSALNGVSINRGEPNNWGDLGLHPLRQGADDPRNTSPHAHMCYHVKLSRSASKCVCINRMEPPELGSLGDLPPCFKGGADPGNTPFSACYSVEFGRLRSNSASLMKRIHMINLTSRIPPFKVKVKVVGTDTNRSVTCDFLLTFHGNHGPVS